MDQKTVTTSLYLDCYEKLKERAKRNKRAVTRELQHIVEEAIKAEESPDK